MKFGMIFNAQMLDFEDLDYELDQLFFSLVFRSQQMLQQYFYMGNIAPDSCGISNFLP